MIARLAWVALYVIDVALVVYGAAIGSGVIA
jgi:hypothetical protein